MNRLFAQFYEWTDGKDRQPKTLHCRLIGLQVTVQVALDVNEQSTNHHRLINSNAIKVFYWAEELNERNVSLLNGSRAAPNAIGRWFGEISFFSYNFFCVFLV